MRIKTKMTRRCSELKLKMECITDWGLFLKTRTDLFDLDENKYNYGSNFMPQPEKCFWKMMSVTL